MKLTPYLQLKTSGARSIELFTIEHQLYLAVPQLAKDMLDMPANMNGGNSDTHVLIFRWEKNQFILFQSLPVHGGEHVAFGLVNKTPMLAIANIRSGQQPQFDMHTNSSLYAWNGQHFVHLQDIPSFAAKSTCLYTIEGEYFLGISEGVIESKEDEGKPSQSHIYRWDGNQFSSYQSIPSLWGYDMNHFTIDGHTFLGIADNLSGSTLYIWQDKQFKPFQSFSEHGGGRQFCYFTCQGNHYIAFANLLSDSMVYQWDGQQFTHWQTLEGAGARHFHFQRIRGQDYLFRTNFITGTRENPITKQDSIVYLWDKNKCKPVTSYVTYGGTAAQTFIVEGRYYLAVSNSLTEDTRFAVDSVIYTL